MTPLVILDPYTNEIEDTAIWNDCGGVSLFGHKGEEPKGQ